MTKFSLSFRPSLRAGLAALLVASVSACTGGGSLEPEATPEANPESDMYTPELLAEYRAILPKRNVLRAPTTTSDISAVIGNPADYPSFIAPQVTSVNEVVGGLIDGLEAITDLPPTFYNSETLEFVWGPYDNEDSAMVDDKILVYIKDTGETEDFRYQYAFIRSVGNDVATFAPVIWGGASGSVDGNDDVGSGAVLYDFEANTEFELANNPDPADLASGRFAVVYARDEDGADSATYVVSAFRDFQPEDAEQAATFDQFYGHFEKGATADEEGYVLDFADVELAANIFPDDGATDGTPEDISIRVALINGGYGRGEALVTGGDLNTTDGDSKIDGVECWDQVVARTFFEANVTGELAGEEDSVVIETEGDFDTGCPNILALSLTELNIPSLDDVDASLLDALDNLATNGLTE